MFHPVCYIGNRKHNNTRNQKVYAALLGKTPGIQFPNNRSHCKTRTKMASGIRMTLFRISLYPLIIFPNGILSCFYPLSTEKMLFFNCRLRETASRSYAAMPQVCGSCVNIIIILFIFPWMLS